MQTSTMPRNLLSLPLLFLTVAPLCGQTSLHQLADARGKLIGTALSTNMTNNPALVPQPSRDIAATEFNGYVAENVFKMRNLMGAHKSANRNFWICLEIAGLSY